MMTATDRDSGTREAVGEASRYAVLFVLEGVSGSERQATYQVLTSIFQDQGVKIIPAHISRFCLEISPEDYLPDLLEAVGATRLSSDKLADDIRGGIAMQLSSKFVSLPERIREFFHFAKARNIELAALSGLPQASAMALMDSLGLTELGIQLVLMEHDNVDHFPRADSWLKLSRSMKKSPKECAVIAGNRVEVKAAMSAGMRCVAVPDQFTAFEDFSGSNAIIEDISEYSLEQLLDVLCPHIGD